MIVVKIAIVASRKRIDRMVKISRIESLITLRTHRAIRYPPMPTPRATPLRQRKRTHRPIRATTNTNFMMIPEAREFCFISFILSFLITSDIFFHASSVSFGRFLFQGQQAGIGFQTSIFFRLNTLVQQGKRKILEKTEGLNMWSKSRTYLCPMNKMTEIEEVISIVEVGMERKKFYLYCKLQFYD